MDSLDGTRYVLLDRILGPDHAKPERLGNSEDGPFEPEPEDGDIRAARY